jgi:hypothetical protein
VIEAPGGIGLPELDHGIVDALSLAQFTPERWARYTVERLRAFLPEFVGG